MKLRMTNRNWLRRFAFVLAAAAVTVSFYAESSLAQNSSQSRNRRGDHDWTLGPTGARGWIRAWKHTADAREIQITRVAKDSPADGVLKAGDSIRGVEGKPFDDDARIQFARAVTRAEQEEANGVLRLVRKREGKTANVEIRIPVMGSYSSTAPYDCPKSAKIFELGCQAIAKRGVRSVSIPNSINALALLASGKPEFRSMLSGYANKVADYRVGGLCDVALRLCDFVSCGVCPGNGRRLSYARAQTFGS